MRKGISLCKTKKDFHKIKQLKTQTSGIKKHLRILFFLLDTMCYCIFHNLPVWYMDIDTTANYKLGGAQQHDSVRLDPWVFMFSAGYRF
ncbi:outer membrane protein W [Escherichia coli]|nr:outer membrane protein W [Escherichia coli]CAD6125976.1 outer membrane protein W [Escherichia coli]